ncbi:MAG: sulfatase-like hydrolase/transferase [Proteobacteria bacterium]|nr:sulfatase-like hydrolase/transferase [Pseudomonadota bacterium]MCP4920337.1 sulfatase-like hydrolase/transferase [Pseudomonadota bacterium]
MTRAVSVLHGASLGAGFALLEGLSSFIHPGLGPDARSGEVLVGVVAWAIGGALLGAAPQGRRLVPLGLLLAVSAHAGTVLGLPWLAPIVLLGCFPLVLRPRLLSFVALVSACVPSSLRDVRAEPLGGTGEDLVLITVDTLRADAELGLTGAWTRCDEAIAPAPWTLPSVYGLMTGSAVRHHQGGLRAGTGYTVADEGLVRLPERFPDHARGAFVHNPHLRAELFGRGWDRFEQADTWRAPLLLQHSLGRWSERLELGPDPVRQRRDEALAAAAEAWWEGAGDGRLLWLHLLGPHEYRRSGNGSRAAYDAQVERTGRLVDELVRSLDADRVVVTSDHGERIEGPSPGHGKDLADDQVHVPVWISGLVECSGQVALIDIESWLRGEVPDATVVELGGVRADPQAFEARAEGGTRLERSAPSIRALVDEPDATWVERLEALGYVDE